MIAVGHFLLSSKRWIICEGSLCWWDAQCSLLLDDSLAQPKWGNHPICRAINDNLLAYSNIYCSQLCDKIKSGKGQRAVSSPDIHTAAINNNFIIKRKIYCLFKLVLSYCFIFSVCLFSGELRIREKVIYRRPPEQSKGGKESFAVCFIESSRARTREDLEFSRARKVIKENHDDVFLSLWAIIKLLSFPFPRNARLLKSFSFSFRVCFSLSVLR